jgi:integrase
MPRVLVRDKGEHRAFELYFVDALSGREKTRSARTRDRREAERAAARWEAELATGGASKGNGWHHARQAFSAYIATDKAVSTQASYLRALDLFEEYVGAPRDLMAITPVVLDGFSAKLAKRDTSPATRAKHLRGLRVFLRYCESRGLMPRAPKVPMPKGASKPKAKGEPIDEKQFEQLLAALPESWRVYTRGLWLSGLRTSEAIALHWTDGPVRLDLPGRRIHFEAAGQKARRDESMPLVADLVAFFEALPYREGPVLRCPAKDAATVSQAFAAGRASLDFFVTPNDLRRSFGTRWAPFLNHIELQTIMRHKDIATTLGYYARIKATDLADSIAAKSAPKNAPKVRGTPPTPKNAPAKKRQKPS